MNECRKKTNKKHSILVLYGTWYLVVEPKEYKVSRRLHIFLGQSFLSAGLLEIS